MKKHAYLFASISIFLVFVVFTILVKTVDVKFIYNNTYLGFYSLNYKFGNWVTEFGKYEIMSKFSDIIFYLSFGYVLVLLVFAIIELVKTKSLKKIDRRYYVLLGGYVVTAFLYLMFEIMKINYSPASVVGDLKPSYPSSHVFIGCVLYLLNSYTALKLLKPEKDWIKDLVYGATIVICVLLTFTRALSTKHWLTDVIASIILVCFVYTLFIYCSSKFVSNESKKENEEQSLSQLDK